MANAKHARGPLQVSKCGIDLVVYSETQQAFDVAHIFNGGNQREMEAYASLFAAAPDLLAALRSLIPSLEARLTAKSKDVEAWDLLNAAKAAIAKVEVSA
jgi:hypothetical protein